MEASRQTQNPNMTGLRYAIAVILQFREMLLTMLGASGVASLRLVVSLNLTDEERLLYLNPIRNLFGDCTWTDARIASGAKMAIVGAGRDVDMVMEIGNTGQDELLELEGMNIWLLIMHERAFKFPISSHTSNQRAIMPMLYRNYQRCAAVVVNSVWVDIISLRPHRSALHAPHTTVGCHPCYFLIMIGRMFLKLILCSLYSFCS
jgi:hypothetical protein